MPKHLRTTCFGGYMKYGEEEAISINVITLAWGTQPMQGLARLRAKREA